MGKGYRPEMAQTLFSDKSNNSVTSQRRTERLLPGPACGREWAPHYTTLGPPCLQPSGDLVISLHDEDAPEHGLGGRGSSEPRALQCSERGHRTSCFACLLSINYTFQRPRTKPTFISFHSSSPGAGGEDG